MLDKLAPPLKHHMASVTAQPEQDYRHQIPLQILHAPSLCAAMPNTKWGLILFDHFKHPNFKIQSIKNEKKREKKKHNRGIWEENAIEGWDPIKLLAQ